MITYHLTRLSDGRVMFAPPSRSLHISPPSHTFPDDQSARWFVKGWHYAHHKHDTPGPQFTIEIE
jgi:hypothetical protein